MRLAATVPALAVLLVVATACMGDDGGDDGGGGAQLEFAFADGTRYTTDDSPTVTCDRTLRRGLDRMNLSIPLDGATGTRYFHLIFVTSLVEKERTWKLPYGSGDEDTEMFMFVAGEGSIISGAKGSSGTVTISRAACGDDPELEASFNATLGSESTGSGGVTVTGEIERVQAAPEDGPTLEVSRSPN